MLLSSDTVFIEIDFPSVIKKKISLINQSQFLKSYTANAWDKQSCLNINQFNDNYFLLEADLSNLSALELLFNKIKTDYNMPTLFVSECVITYMKGERLK